MSNNLTGILGGDSSGLLVFKAFLLPILYVSVAFLTVTGDAIAKQFCSKTKNGKLYIRKNKAQSQSLSREYSVEKTREEVLQEALKRGAQLEFFSTKRTFENFCSMNKRNIVPPASRELRTVRGGRSVRACLRAPACLAACGPCLSDRRGVLLCALLLPPATVARGCETESRACACRWR